MKSSSKVSSAKISSDKDFLEGVEKWIDEKKWFFFSAFLILTGWFAYTHFDARMSFATDDAGYVNRAFNFLKKGDYPGFQGALYPLFLSAVMALFGFKLILFKSFSIVFLILHIAFLWLAFYKRIPNTVLIAVCLFVSLNPYILYYGSFTFNEAFMMFIQSLMFYVVFKQMDKIEVNDRLAQTWKNWMLFGLLLLLLSITKNISIVAIGVFVFYFILKREWKNAALSIAAFAFFKVLYEAISRGLFNATTTTQLPGLMRKNYYDPSLGNEDLMGYVNRFFENFQNYISIHFFKIVGLGTQTIGLKPGETAAPAETSFFFSLIFLLLFGFSVYILFNRNKYAFIGLIYSAGTLAVMFIAIQVHWNQDRLIVPFIPLLILAFFTSVYYWIKENDNPVLKVLMVGLFIWISLLQFPATARISKQNSVALKKYKKGNTTYGFNQTVVNFIEVNEWIKKNLPDDSIKIGTNKPEEAFIYAQKPVFLRVANMNGKTADDVLKYLKENNFTHLELDPFGNKVASAFQPVYEKYPQKLQLLTQAGNEQGACYLFKINY